MPTLPLYATDVGHPDAWHQVTAPGGYEWWYFDAEDAAGQIHIVAIFFDGFVFHPGYLREHARYLRRPTHRPPALPRDYPCVYFIVYEGGKMIAQFMTQYPPGSLIASKERPDLAIGPNALATHDDAIDLRLSGTPWRLTGTGPNLLEGQELRASLTYRPILPHTPRQRTFLSREMTAADHHWVLANPLCAVEGTIHLVQNCKPRQIDFTGRGYHDHNFGSGPLGPGLRHWMWGRILLPDRVFTFHLASPKRRNMDAEYHLIEADAAGVREITFHRPPPLDLDQRTALFLHYPSMLELAPNLRLHSPRVIDSAPFYLRLLYTLSWEGREVTAFCELAYPHRLRRPVLGRMIEMSIHRPPQP